MLKNIIAFSGTHGTSKSSSAYACAAKLKIAGKNIIVIDELARECPLPINQTAGELTQYWIISAQIKREIETCTKYDYIISDRSIFDAYAYGCVLGNIDDSFGKFIANYINNNYYKILLLDPTAFNYQIDDGIRDMDVEFRQSVHEKLLHLYYKYNIDVQLIKNQSEIDMIIDELSHPQGKN